MDISVIIPLYNAQETITSCLESVIESCVATHFLWEIIVVNDGSTDKSLEVVTAYISTSAYRQQITILTQTNKGVSSARNAGMAAAKGRYIAFNDADDRWSKNHLAILVECLENNPHIELVAGVFGNDKVSQVKKIAHLTPISIADQMKKNYFTSQAAALRKETLYSIEPFCETMRYFEDYRFFNQIVHRGSAYVTPHVITYPIIDKYRWGEKGLSGNLWAMEKGELYAIKIAFEQHYITRTHYFFTVTLSVTKFLRRLFIQGFRTLLRTKK